MERVTDRVRGTTLTDTSDVRIRTRTHTHTDTGVISVQCYSRLTSASKSPDIPSCDVTKHGRRTLMPGYTRDED